MNPLFPKYPSYNMHPANIALDFTYRDGISEAVLRNFLSRAQNCTLFDRDCEEVTEDLRMLFHTGAKLICRAATPWTMGDWEFPHFEKMRYYINLAHGADPELIFESCIFESIYKTVETIPVPDYVFAAFGLGAQKRNFSYSAMLFPDGRFVDHWGPGGSVPDITRLETQLWFYYRATLFIDLGFECLHLGQVMLMGKNDAGFAVWDRVISMIRDYARSHTRRGWILLNAHVYDDRIGDRLLFDFHISPARGLPPEDAAAHKPSEDDPQEIRLCVGHLDSIYQKSVGGITPCGWKTDSLPYIVELDNYCGCVKEELDKPLRPAPGEWFIEWWGFDEISWFTSQPRSYRHKWLAYAWDFVYNIDSAGYFQMPGHRPAALRKGDDLMTIESGCYRANSSEHLPGGFDDEEHIRSIWVKDRQNRQ